MICKHCNNEVEEGQFCPKCGAPLENASEVAKTTDIDNRYGFKGGLASTIMEASAFIFSFIAIAACAFSPAVGIILAIACITVSIIGLVKGIKAIKAFAYAKRTANAKPVATLVLGIVGCCMAGLVIIFALEALLIGAGAGILVNEAAQQSSYFSYYD